MNAVTYRPTHKAYRVAVTCEGCGFRQCLEREIRAPGYVFLRCHGCEHLLRVAVTADRFPVTSVDYDLPR